MKLEDGVEAPTEKKRCMSADLAKGPRYELGRIISSGMIGMVYLAQAKDTK